MLKYITVSVMLVAASAMGWLQLKDVPHEADVDTGAHLLWGDGRVWGVFPSDNPSMTYFYSYDADQDPWDPEPDSCHWDTLPIMSAARLSPCCITFQPGQDPTIWGIGKTGGLSLLKHYVDGAPSWVEDTIDSFTLGEGASIAYAPNPGFDPLTCPIPGYLYCLPDDSTSFWKYNIGATDLPDPGTYGYLYPDTGATIADQTPMFRWNPAGVIQYRIVVSTDPSFKTTIVDAVVFTNEYEMTIELDDGTYYWRTAAWSGGQWQSCAAAYYWFTLDGGWTRCAPIDSNPDRGAEIAYDAGSFDENHSPGILAIYNRTHRQFSRYVIEGDAWQCGVWDNTPCDVKTGSSITTSALVEGAFPYHIDALFWDQQEDDYPYIFCPDSPPGHQWQKFILENEDPDWDTGLPDDIEVGSSMIIGDSSYAYLVTGHQNRFYRVEPEGFARSDPDQGGRKAHVAGDEGPKAQAIAFHDGIEAEYQLPAAARVRATLHDAVGRRIGVLDEGAQKAGTHRLSWDRDQHGRKLSAGAYFVLLAMGKEQVRLKVVVR